MSMTWDGTLKNNWMWKAFDVTDVTILCNLPKVYYVCNSDHGSRPGLCSDASLEVFYVNYLSEVFYVENR